jgi:hypothetical protein
MMTVPFAAMAVPFGKREVPLEKVVVPLAKMTAVELLPSGKMIVVGVAPGGSDEDVAFAVGTVPLRVVVTTVAVTVAELVPDAGMEVRIVVVIVLAAVVLLAPLELEEVED